MASSSGQPADSEEPEPVQKHDQKSGAAEHAALNPELLEIIEEDRAKYIDECNNLRAMLAEPDATQTQLEEQKFVVFGCISSLNELLRTAGMRWWGGGVNSLLSEVRATVDDDRFVEEFVLCQRGEN